MKHIYENGGANGDMDVMKTGDDADITEYNLSRSSARLSSEAEKRAAHLCELARTASLMILSSSDKTDIIDALIHRDESEKMLDGLFRRLPGISGFDAANAEEAEFLSDGLTLYDTLYICRGISRFCKKNYAEDELMGFLSDDEIKNPAENGEIKVSFIRGKQANAAFEAFARYVFGVMPSGCESFADVCESTFSGETDFCIVPVESSSDGRLGSFYGMIEKYGLYIVMLCETLMPDGENHTKFALCARSMRFIGAAGKRIFHFKLTLDSPDELFAVLAAGKYYKTHLLRADLVPASVAGRESSFDFVFRTDGADLAGFICFLKLIFPQFLPVGMYTELETEARK